jgi:hypothetical protein
MSAAPLPPGIDTWLRSNLLINRFCTQNGWIDDDTLRYEVSSSEEGWTRINVYFTELVMEGSGCVADRVACFGQIDLRLDGGARVLEAKVA